MSITQILIKHQMWLKDQVGGERANLSGMELRDTDLNGVDLTSALMVNTRLSRSNLAGAKLAGADMRSALLDDAQLGSANLREANLSGAVLQGADTLSAIFHQSILTGANISGINLCYVVGNGQRIKNLCPMAPWWIAYTTESMAIGCEQHSLTDWQNFNDTVIGQMATHSLALWQTNKQPIFDALAAFPAVEYVEP